KSFSWGGTAWVPEFWFKDITWYNFTEMKWTYYLGQEYVLGVWRNYERGYGFYNSIGLPLKYEYQEYIVIVWVNSFRERWEYDSFYNIKLDVNEEWVTNSWVISYGERFEFEYDANNNISVEYAERWFEIAKGWTKVHKLQSWYQNITGTPFLPGDTFTLSVYPNPVSSILSFNAQGTNTALHYQITDLRGRLIQSGALNNAVGGRNEVGVNELNSGVYILSIFDGQQKRHIRFIKQ
ncbi:MAG: T9SS type A sorting domain-containing protein, partial [Bacteroidales bacterium]|nr:T9SS type A sorting domain-containing protein [Bacteroidales bacterium]